MSGRKENFQKDNFYHIANYSVENIALFRDVEDFQKFLKMLDLFNSIESKGSSVKYQKDVEMNSDEDRIFDLLAYALVHNHFHIFVKVNQEELVSKFMQRLNTGYAMYFNKKYKRRGGLFQGRFVSKRVPKESIFEIVSYINLNYQIHGMKLESFRLINSENISKRKYLTSETEYLGRSEFNLCLKKYILDNFTMRKFNNFSKKIVQEFLEDKITFLE